MNAISAEVIKKEEELSKEALQECSERLVWALIDRISNGSVTEPAARPDYVHLLGMCFPVSLKAREIGENRLVYGSTVSDEIREAVAERLSECAQQSRNRELSEWATKVLKEALSAPADGVEWRKRPGRERLRILQGLRSAIPGETRVRDAAVGLLGEESYWVRREAVYLLRGSVGDEEVCCALLSCLAGDSDEGVRQAALSALGNVGEAEVSVASVRDALIGGRGGVK